MLNAVVKIAVVNGPHTYSTVDLPVRMCKVYAMQYKQHLTLSAWLVPVTIQAVQALLILDVVVHMNI